MNFNIYLGKKKFTNVKQNLRDMTFIDGRKWKTEKVALLLSSIFFQKFLKAQTWQISWESATTY